MLKRTQGLKVGRKALSKVYLRRRASKRRQAKGMRTPRDKLYIVYSSRGSIVVYQRLTIGCLLNRNVHLLAALLTSPKRRIGVEVSWTSVSET